MNDKFGVKIKVGDVVLKAITLGRSPFIEERVVTRINVAEGKIYLSDSKVAINYPERLVVFKRGAE